MKRFCALVAGVSALALASQAWATAFVTMGFSYAGSTTANLTPNQVISGLGIVSNSNLSQVDLSNSTFQTTSWRHYFDLTVVFHPDGQNQALRLLGVDVTFGGGIHAITPSGVADQTSQKYYGFNPTIDTIAGHPNAFLANADAGPSNGDFRALIVIDSNATNALALQVGVGGGVPVTGEGLTSQPFDPVTHLGRFAIQFDGPLTTEDAIISALPPIGTFFSYFLDQNPQSPNNNSFNTVTTPPGENGLGIDPGFIAPGSPNVGLFAIHAPEPTTLAIAVPAMMLLFRRRRAR